MDRPRRRHTRPGDYLPLLRPVLPFTDVFLPNTDEATLILGEADPVRQALAFRAISGPKRVVVTRWASEARSPSPTISEPAWVPTRSSYVDGTGGGDSFDAGYIAGLIEGLPELECLKLASAVGASCVRAVGTTAGIFTRDEARRFIESHDLTVESF